MTRSPNSSAPWGYLARLAACGLLISTLGACRSGEDAGSDALSSEREAAMSLVAEEYVRLVLALGVHDPDTVDAYLGPEAWRDEAETAAASFDQIRQRVDASLAELAQIDLQGVPLIEQRRHRNLAKSLVAVTARIDVLEGVSRTFDEESKALFDAVAPHHTEADFEAALARLDELLPGSGEIAARYEAYVADFIVPDEKVDEVFRAAVDACRLITGQYIDLPEGESFEIEYVTDKSWSGYNWYKGNYHSLIQVNRDLPITIDRALDLACHEGYPGHHVYNLLVERDLLNARGWQEFSIYALFSPRSLIAEGTANYGVEVAFYGEGRVAFEREVLFPLAGFDPDRVAEFYEIHAARGALDYAGNEAARRYLDGEIDREEAADWLTRYALMPTERAEQRTKFFDQYRTYVINYNLGQDLARAYVEARIDDHDGRWREFQRLLEEPFLPSDLAKEPGDAPEHSPQQ